MLQEGKVDMIVATYSITDQRRQKVDFAGPYFSASQDIMIRAGDTSITSVADLAGKRVCTARGSTSLQNLVKENAEAVVVARDTYSECASALAAGEVDAVTTDQPILAGYAVSDPRLRVLHNPFSHEDYGIGIAKGDEALRSFINGRLAHIEESGDWGRAARYWLGDIYLPPPIDNTRK
jgi:glutamate transport system substrate-binding protein